MAQIFISYRRGPTGYVAHLLAEQIKAEFGPKAVFMDIDNVPLGVDFRDYIGAAVSECQVLLVLIGDDWLTARLRQPAGPGGRLGNLEPDRRARGFC